MRPCQCLPLLALRQLAQAIPQGEVVGAAADFLMERFTDHSQRLNRALQEANDLAWRSLEIALDGETLWTRVDRSEDKAFRQQVRAFLDGAPLVELAGKTEFRKQCVREIRKARKAMLLSGGPVDAQDLARSVGEFARFHDPQSVLNAEWQALDALARELKQAGYANLGALLQIKPVQGASLLVIAVRYFFRRAVEGDEALFRGLAFARMERLQQDQEQAFSGLHQILTRQGQRIEALLEGVQSVVAETHAGVLDLQAELKAQGEQGRDLYQEVLRLKEKLDLMHEDVRPRDSLSIRSDAERQLVKQLVGRYRALSEDRRRKMPALLNALGQLQLAAGDFGEAERHFKEVTSLVVDPAARGEAYLNAYRAALEQQKQELALEELLKAVKLDGKRFAPFPVGKYHPKRILGAGGFGVAFLCRHKDLDADVVVKTLHNDRLNRSVDEVLAEARLLYQLDHPCIVRLLDCGYTVPSSKSRPYFVMSYFDSSTLEEQARRGVLAVQDGLEVARLMAEGLQAAHAKGILHRDVKPANVLVRKDANGWQVKLIDFGLALRTEYVRNTMRAPSARQHSIEGSSIAGTVEYAAPEQMGRLPGVPVGFYSDLYGWGKTCCYALFGTAQPLPKHWKAIPDHLAGVLGQCLEENPQERPTSCAEVLDRLSAPNGRKSGARPRLSVPNATGESAHDEQLPIAPSTDWLPEVIQVSRAARPEPEEMEAKDRNAARAPGKQSARARAAAAGPQAAKGALPPPEWQSNRQTIGIIALLLGSFGVHKFMLGIQQPAIVMLAVSLVGLFCILGVGWYVMIVFGVIEGIKYLNMSDAEFYSTYVVGKKPWF